MDFMMVMGKPENQWVLFKSITVWEFNIAIVIIRCCYCQSLFFFSG